jgi:hypothetical protein
VQLKREEPAQEFSVRRWGQQEPLKTLVNKTKEEKRKEK